MFQFEDDFTIKDDGVVEWHLGDDGIIKVKHKNTVQKDEQDSKESSEKESE